MERRHLLLDSQIKTEADGVITGYGSVFGVVDTYGDAVQAGAFSDSLRQRKPAMLWQHEAYTPIGVWDAVVEDDKGLRVSGRVALSTQRGREAWELARMGALSGLSIGYRIREFESGAPRKLTVIDLYEVSLVTFPANDLARVESVRSAADAPAFERMLREKMELSRSQAKALMAAGFKALCQRDAGDGAKPLRDAEGIVSALTKLRDTLNRGGNHER